MYAAGNTLPGANLTVQMFFDGFDRNKDGAIDKAEWDAPQGTRTLPVLLGDRRARRVTQGLMATFYVSLAVLVGIGALPWPTLLAYAALPALVKVWRAFDRPRPDQPPPRFPVWPLWFAAIAFLHTRRAGALLVAGLAVGAILGY